MEKDYITLFIELARANEQQAEQVMEYDNKLGDKKGAQTAAIMREDYRRLGDKLKDSANTLQKSDYTKLLVGALVVSNNINDKIKTLQKAQNGYKIDLIPKLERVLAETETDEEAQKLANEIFKFSI